jgi:hypothetical protein
MNALINPHEIHIGRGPNNERVYLMPSLRDYRYMHVFDWPQHEDRWLHPAKKGIPNISRGERKKFQENHLMNLHNYEPMKDWKKLWGKEDGKTALFVSSGPSLPESAAEIQRLAKRDDTFTIGINRAIRAVPLDYYFILDRWGSDDWFQDGPFKKTTLIASTTVNHFFPPMFNKIYWCEHWHCDPPAPVTGVSTDLSITITDALMCAYKMGAKRVLLYGCDYSCTYTIDDRGYKVEMYYFDRHWTQEADKRPKDYHAHYAVEGIHDEIVLMNRELMMYATYTKCMCLMLENAGVPVYNRTPRGMLFHRWDEKPEWDEKGDSNDGQRDGKGAERGPGAVRDGRGKDAGGDGGRLVVAKH